MFCFKDIAAKENYQYSVIFLSQYVLNCLMKNWMLKILGELSCASDCVSPSSISENFTAILQKTMPGHGCFGQRDGGI